MKNINDVVNFPTSGIYLFMEHMKCIVNVVAQAEKIKRASLK